MIVLLGDLGAGGGGRIAPVQANATRAAAAGSRVEIVGIVPDDPDGDRRILALAGAGIGHAAVLRGPSRPLEAEDVDLALRYLPEVGVIVAVDASGAALRAAQEQAGWSDATFLIVRQASTTDEDGDRALPDGAVVLEAPPADPDGTFAGFVGALAAKIDGGATPADAWAATTRELAVDPA